jgi:hypothetical protein
MRAEGPHVPPNIANSPLKAEEPKSYSYSTVGAPIANEDDAGRAVQAAFELQNLTQEINGLQTVQI